MEEKKSRKKFYSPTMSRRDFMKMLGMGSVGMGAMAMGLSPEMPFSDLDEMKSSAFADRKLPFWVKEVDEPTVEIDWDMMEVFPSSYNTLFNPKIMGLEDAAAVTEARVDLITSNIKNKKPGASIQDHALSSALSYGWMDRKYTSPWTGPEHPPADLTKYLKPTLYATPEELGVPRYEGTPEENSKMLRVAGRIMGAVDMGFVKLDENTKKLLYGNIKFEDVEEGYSDPETYTNVLPNKDLWVICSVIPQSLIQAQLSDSRAYAAPSGYGYSRGRIFSSRLKMFLRGSGYQQYGHATDSGRSVGFGVLAGLAEISPATIGVSPHLGTAFRQIHMHITDLPLAVTKPIDAGIMDFCKVCKKCAEECPSGAINMDDEPKWPDWEPGEKIIAARGIKGWFLDHKKCITHMLTTGCTVCQGVCPFNKFDSAVMHDLVKMSISSTPALNGVIRKLDDVFGYGEKKGEHLWDENPWDIPLYGLDSSRS